MTKILVSVMDSNQGMCYQAVADQYWPLPRKFHDPEICEDIQSEFVGGMLKHLAYGIGQPSVIRKDADISLIKIPLAPGPVDDLYYAQGQIQLRNETIPTFHILVNEQDVRGAINLVAPQLRRTETLKDLRIVASYVDQACKQR